MKNYYIQVKETLSRIVHVRAEDLEEAMERVQDWANEGEGLTYDDFVDRDFFDMTDKCKKDALKEYFFSLGEVIKSDEEMIQRIRDELEEVYHHIPSDLPYDEVLHSFKRDLPEPYYLQHFASYSYPSGWKGPIAILRKDDYAAILAYIAIGKDNRVHIVKDIMEVK